ncbi:unnamed protein product [Symbiodinium sp. CCMP2592]|nr:unnamed protein product [Symbiodinium sp. CCMP2592]
MIELVDGDTVKRFASAKTLVAEPQSEGVEFILEVGLREKGHQLWDLILRFNQCCVLHPLGARIRRDRPGLSGLAETIRNIFDGASSDGVRLRAAVVSQPASTSSPALPFRCSRLLQVSLHNVDATACYMNASLLALLWSTLHTSVPQLGGLEPVLSFLEARPELLLLRCMAWTMLLGSWSQPRRQHDMHEFLVHLMPRLRLPAIQGYWQQRRLEEDVGAVVCDTSTTVIPITLDLPEGARGLQHCIQAWHSSHYRSAITGDPPELICLHLSRFRQTDGGVIVKDVQALPDIREVIRIPVFRSPADIRVRWCPYQVCAASLHFGPTVERGHYRALLRSKEKIWITEDNRGAQLLSCTELTSLTPHIYLIWCVPDSGLPTAA